MEKCATCSVPDVLARNVESDNRTGASLFIDTHRVLSPLCLLGRVLFWYCSARLSLRKRGNNRVSGPCRAWYLDRLHRDRLFVWFIRPCGTTPQALPGRGRFTLFFTAHYTVSCGCVCMCIVTWGYALFRQTLFTRGIWFSVDSHGHALVPVKPWSL